MTRQLLYSKTSAPTVTDDSGDGYKVGDIWLDETNDIIYQAIDVSLGAAVWKQLSNEAAVGFGDGWTSLSDAWTYSSADSPTFIASSAGNLEGVVSKGMRVRLEQLHALSAYWSFDVDPNADVGTFTEADIGTPTYTAGKFSNALTLDGSTDAISIADDATLKPTGEFTIGVWIKTSATGVLQTIFQSWSQNTNAAGIKLQVSTSNKIKFTSGKNTGSTLNSDYIEVNGAKTVTDGIWHYVVVSYRNNYVQIYVDGILDGNGYAFTPAYAGTNYIRIGCGNSSGTNIAFFNGQIDDLFVINGYALGEGDVLAQYRLNNAQGTGNINSKKYFIVVDVGQYSGGATLVTMYGGTDYSLANSTISNPAYSGLRTPLGFRSNPDKWTVRELQFVNAQKSSPTSITWYGGSGLTSTGPSISAPIGVWVMSYLATMDAQPASSGVMTSYATLSRDNNAESNPEYTTAVSRNPTVYDRNFMQLSGRNLVASSKTTWYMNIKTHTAGSTLIALRGDLSPTTIELVCAFL